jgi:hypothetical protein
LNRPTLVDLRESSGRFGHDPEQRVFRLLRHALEAGSPCRPIRAVGRMVASFVFPSSSYTEMRDGSAVAT